MLSLFAKPETLLVSETDIAMALQHLRGLPHRLNRPLPWDRKRLMDMIREAIGRRPVWDQIAPVAPGVFAHVKPFWCDLSGEPPADMMGKKQVWLLVRPAVTDPERMTEI